MNNISCFVVNVLSADFEEHEVRPWYNEVRRDYNYWARCPNCNLQDIPTLKREIGVIREVNQTR